MNHGRRAVLIGFAALSLLTANAYAGEPPPLLDVGAVCKMWWLGQDTSRAKTFYTNQFAWKFRTPFESVGRVYVPWSDGSGPGGDLTSPDPAGSGIWRPYVRVANLPASLQQASALGGTVLIGSTAYGTNGDKVAVVKDPAGAQIGLWYSPSAPAPGGELGYSAVYRMRLYSPDPAKAKTFYAGMFPSWTWKSPVTIGGRVYTPWVDGTGPGGEVVMPVAGESSGWRAFVRVAQLESAITTATRNGATVVIRPTLHGSWGRYALLADPLGVLIGLWEK